MRLLLFLLLTVSAWGQITGGGYVGEDKSLFCPVCECVTHHNAGTIAIYSHEYGAGGLSDYDLWICDKCGNLFTETKKDESITLCVDRWGVTLSDLIDLWDTYKAECWADSGRDTLRWVFKQSECCDSTMRADSLEMEKKGYGTSWWYNEWPRCCREPILSEWTHRSPDPFEFIDKYLRKKSKGEK